MRDHNIYTEQGLKEVIQHVRVLKAFFNFELQLEEDRLITLYEAAKEFNSPVDTRGQRWQAGKTKKRFSLENLPEYIVRALRSGELVDSRAIEE